MLKGISPLLSPELLATLARMGHGDEIVLADSNFPAASHTRNLLRADGLAIPPLLEAILSLFPLDDFVDHPAAVMDPVDGDAPKPSIWSEYEEAVVRFHSHRVTLERVERFSFYERARSAFAIVATGETAIYANLILKKGVVHP